jgi:hypothetical protein
MGRPRSTGRRNPRTRKKKFEQTCSCMTRAGIEPADARLDIHNHFLPCTGADHRHESFLYPVHSGLGSLVQCVFADLSWLFEVGVSEICLGRVELSRIYVIHSRKKERKEIE